MPSFQSKIRWKMLRKSGKKKRSYEFVPDPEQRIPKKQKKIQKIKKHQYGLFSSKNKLGKARKE